MTLLTESRSPPEWSHMNQYLLHHLPDPEAPSTSDSSSDSTDHDNGSGPDEQLDDALVQDHSHEAESQEDRANSHFYFDDDGNLTLDKPGDSD